jgi:cytoskeletal protein RodZ
MAAWCSLVAAQSTEQPAAPPATPPAASPPSSATADSDQPTLVEDKATIEAAEKWLALLDAGKAGIAWDASSAHLKSVVTRQKWVTEITKTRKPLGKLGTRKAEKFARSHSLPGAPEGDYSIVEFESVYANGKRATEQVIWMFEADSVWRVSGYFIR